ncbi:zinc transporter, ZIP family [Raineyella antarctica]|uniref:Zinc transporter, ZIP family n=1 Tax=Raineyella antarctica TaxID=1577474 RepID=A0A1G6GMX2_9ACTN|nr:ZIP family metal transporter [Raineyella antarctica]SDB82536.1 zinc transporter, ZIP family [Raineyella antarctica]
MSATHVVVLGLIAGLTIFLGLPLGRIRAALPRTRVWLNALAVGILLFLLWDVLAHAWEPIDKGLGDKDVTAVVGSSAVFAIGLAAGLVGLVHFDRWVARRARPVPRPEGPGAATASGVAAAPLSTAHTLSLMIAVGIGLHNFAEGLAIGNSAATGATQLAILLVIGFAIHNGTEGFGIVAPMAAQHERPSWKYLALLGLIGGGPTFFGTIVGQQFSNDLVSVGFLSLAAGSILYVVIELLAVARRQNMKITTTWGVLVGLLLGFATDAVVTLAGA